MRVHEEKMASGLNLHFDLSRKMYTHTYHKCQQHLSSSSAVETNREYLIRMKEERKKNLHAMMKEMKEMHESTLATEIKDDFEKNMNRTIS